MNIDFLDIAKHHGKDKICFEYLKQVASYETGWKKYLLEGLNSIEVWHHEQTANIRLKANFGYYLVGHNFNFKTPELIEGIQQVSELINCNLFDAEVKAFEYGSFIEIDLKPKEFFINHIKHKNKELITFKNHSGKGFEEVDLKFKLYDAGRNLKTKLSKDIRASLKEHYGYDEAKHYIKIESHYKKPQIHFKKRNIYINEVIQDSFMQLCKEDLINSYKSIMKTGIIKLPEKKKDINSSIVPLILLKELETVFGFDAEELLKAKWKSVPEDKLNSYDKKARLHQLKTNLKKINTTDKSIYDITAKLDAKAIS